MNLAQTQQQTRRSLLNFQTPGVRAKSSMGLFFVFLTVQIFDCELAQHIGTDSYLSGTIISNNLIASRPQILSSPHF
jgi:hypothetical protein